MFRDRDIVDMRIIWQLKGFALEEVIAQSRRVQLLKVFLPRPIQEVEQRVPYREARKTCLLTPRAPSGISPYLMRAKEALNFKYA